MIDLGLSGEAVAAAAHYLGQKAAGGAAFSVGAKVVDWIKKRLTGSSEMAAIAHLEQNPNSDPARRMLEEVLVARLKQDASLAQSLESILKESGFSQRASDGSIVVGASGTGITQNVSVGKG